MRRYLHQSIARYAASAKTLSHPPIPNHSKPSRCKESQWKWVKKSACHSIHIACPDTRTGKPLFQSIF